MSDSNSQIMNYAVRMVVPMRREFGYSLDVSLFLANATYQRSVLAKASESQDPRLREYAAYLERCLQGARGHAPPSSAPPPAAPRAEASLPAAKPSALPPSTPSPGFGATLPGEGAAAPAKPVDGDKTLNEAELRQRWRDKYTKGLR